MMFVSSNTELIPPSCVVHIFFQSYGFTTAIVIYHIPGICGIPVPPGICGIPVPPGICGIPVPI